MRAASSCDFLVGVAVLHPVLGVAAERAEVGEVGAGDGVDRRDGHRRGVLRRVDGREHRARLAVPVEHAVEAVEPVAVAQLDGDRDRREALDDRLELGQL